MERKRHTATPQISCRKWEKRHASSGLSRRAFLAQTVAIGSAAILTRPSRLVSPVPAHADSPPLTDPEAIIYASAGTLAKAIREKTVSAEEVVNAYLQRITTVNPKLNAVVQIAGETARQQARAADAAVARGESLGPLHGVPITIKDLFDTAGMVSAAGTKGRATFIPPHDAIAVTRLRAAGAIILGKTNVPELGIGFAETDNLVYGRTNNPYARERTPGASSGGEAAIIAAGGSPLGLGSDGGGSIRTPCHFCGIAGLKPTFGRVPRTGHFPPPGPMLHVGPMARFVDDLTLMLPLIAGDDATDPGREQPLPLQSPATVNLKALRAAFFTNNGIIPPSPETAEVIQRVAKTIGAVGIVVEEARPAGIEHSYDVFLGFLAADGGAWIQRLLTMAGTAEASPAVLRAQEWLRAVKPTAEPAEVFQSLRTRLTTMRMTMLSFMEKYEVLLCPVSGHSAMPREFFAINDNVRTLSYAQTFNLLGWPAVVVRAGTSPDGLPIGVQIVARPWREDIALAVASQIEHALGGWKPPPL